MHLSKGQLKEISGSCVFKVNCLAQWISCQWDCHSPYQKDWFIPALYVWLSSLSMCILGGRNDGSRMWVPVINTGDSDGVPSHWLSPDLAIAITGVEVNQQVGFLYIFLFLSLFLSDKK